MFEDYQVVKEIIANGRFHVVLSKANVSPITIPKAHYVWLKNNPSFSKIPKGYVIHHLDCDERNDDPSNLALMQKYHHTSYHLKQKTVSIPIEIIEGKTIYCPKDLKKIKIYQSDRDRWVVQWYENGKRTRLYSINGQGFKCREEAERAIDRLVKARFLSR